jgi:predicted RNA binding protein YcfA (HicA-like mRNA interferase family)
MKSQGGGMKFREVEKMILDDGWYFKTTKGSHNHYKHPTKTGKVTIPKHIGDLDLKTVKSIMKQAGLK